jgi:CheY-like chemotaxis protein
MEALSRLAGGMAHDFNNALMTIMGHIEMLEARLGEAEGSNEEIVEIKAACDRAASLTRQLLAFDRRPRGELAVLDASRVVGGLEKMLRRLLGEDVELVVRPTSGPALVRFEVGKIEQILLDLAMRERELMPTGGRFTVTVCEPESQPSHGGMFTVAEDIGNWTEVRVTGTGLGLDAECLAWCREAGGSETVPPGAAGLGLGAVQESIWRNGGRVTARRGPGEEMAVTIYLRRAAPDRAHASSHGLEPDHLSGCETVLLAEDEVAVRDLVRGGLSRLGYLVLDAPDGPTALDRAAFHDGPIDLLITDIAMPGMTGHELAERLLVLHPGAKIICMSGYPEEAVGSRGIRERGAIFLQKPFTSEVLARTLRDVLKREPPNPTAQ